MHCGNRPALSLLLFADSQIGHTNVILSELHMFVCSEEVRLLKEELSEDYEADKQAALTQVSQQKELEMMAAREGWQRKVEDLLEQVTHVASYTHTHTHTVKAAAWGF